jgi:hypothetical protein
MKAFLVGYTNITIFEETSIISIDNTPKEVKLTANNKSNLIYINCKKVSLSCGRWIGKLIP